MYVHNPQVVLHAMCFVHGAKDEKECGFVQFPQSFYDTLKDDPFGNQMIVIFEVSKSFVLSFFFLKKYSNFDFS